MTETVLQQGVDLMVYGMGTIFLFLAILVTVITVVSTVIGRFFLEPEAALELELPLRKSASTKAINPEALSARVLSTNVLSTKKVLAIMQNAIDQHRGDK